MNQKFHGEKLIQFKWFKYERNSSTCNIISNSLSEDLEIRIKYLKEIIEKTERNAA